MSYLDSSHFSDNNGHIICSISIYRFKDMKYAILNELMPKNEQNSFYYYIYSILLLLSHFQYLNSYLKFKL